MQQKSWSESSTSSSSSSFSDEIPYDKETNEKELAEGNTIKKEESMKDNGDSIDEGKLLSSFKSCLARKELVKPFFAENISAIEKLEKRYAQEDGKITSQDILVLVLFLNMFKYKYFTTRLRATTPQSDLERHFTTFINEMVRASSKESQACHKKLSDFVSFCDTKSVLGPQVIAQAHQAISDSFKCASAASTPQSMLSLLSSAPYIPVTRSTVPSKSSLTGLSSVPSLSVSKSAYPRQGGSLTESSESFFSADSSSFDSECPDCENSTPKYASDTQFQPPWMTEGYKVRRSTRYASQGRIPSFLGSGGYDFGSLKTPRSATGSGSGSSGSGSAGRKRSKLGTLSYSNSSLDDAGPLGARTMDPSPVLPQSFSGTCYSSCGLGVGSNVVTPTFSTGVRQQVTSLSVGSKPYSDQLRHVNVILYSRALKDVKMKLIKTKYSVEDKKPSVEEGKSPSTIGFKRAWEEFIERNDKKKKQKS